MASHIALSPQHVGILQDTHVSPASLNEASRLLQKNHDNFHIFFRDVTGHNHTAHSILTHLALGAGPSEIQRAYADTEGIQRAMPRVDEKLLHQLHSDDDGKLSELLGSCDQYATFLAFFQAQIDQHGWKPVVTRYVFARTPIAEKMLVKMFEGMYHSFIHLGLGIEFNQPGIVAEALAQAATHQDDHISKLLFPSEALAAAAAASQPTPAHPADRPNPTLVDLLNQVRSNRTIYEAPQWEDGWNRMRIGVMDQASHELAPIAAQFTVHPPSLDTLHLRTAEMISVSAYLAGASSQRPGRKRKIDFFLMHIVTSSLFFSVLNRQEWIALENRIRLVEWKGRLDLAFYAFCRCPDLDAGAIVGYSDGETDGMGWEELYAAVNGEHDDGHVAKFIRALKNGESAVGVYGDDGEWGGGLLFPVKGEMWVRLARMALGSTRGGVGAAGGGDLKWVMGTGFDQAWTRPDLM